MWEGKLQVLGEQLANIRTLDILFLWDFNNTNNLRISDHHEKTSEKANVCSQEQLKTRGEVHVSNGIELDV